MSDLAVTWWGHSTVTVELAGLRIALDPLLVDRLWHLHRFGPTPAAAAADADLVLVSHLHTDHLHLPSLRQFAHASRIVVPSGSARLMRGLHDRITEVAPGDRLRHGPLTIEVLESDHDGRRHPRSPHVGPALGFRVAAGESSFWFPGDTGLQGELWGIEPVDLALVPIGGWGPTLGHQHLDPRGAAEVLSHVSARWAIPVHYGTFWPIGLRHFQRRTHRDLFMLPQSRFVEAVAERRLDTQVLLPAHGERVVLGGDS